MTINTADAASALSDLAKELRSSELTLEVLASEIAQDYGLNPAYLVRLFNTTYPDGLPQVDVEKAERLEKELKARQADYRRREAEAIEEFFSAPAHVRRGGVRPIEQQDILRALASWPSRYETRDGETVIGNTIGGLVQELRSKGARVSAFFDHGDVEKLGVRIVQAQYTGGARNTGKFVNVAVLPDFPHLKASGLKHSEALDRALDLAKYMTERTGEEYPLGEAIASVIDAAIEHAQG